MSTGIPSVIIRQLAAVYPMLNQTLKYTVKGRAKLNSVRKRGSNGQRQIDQITYTHWLLSLQLQLPHFSNMVTIAWNGPGGFLSFRMQFKLHDLGGGVCAAPVRYLYWAGRPGTRGGQCNARR